MKKETYVEIMDIYDHQQEKDLKMGEFIEPSELQQYIDGFFRLKVFQVRDPDVKTPYNPEKNELTKVIEGYCV